MLLFYSPILGSISSSMLNQLSLGSMPLIFSIAIYLVLVVLCRFMLFSQFNIILFIFCTFIFFIITIYSIIVILHSTQKYQNWSYRVQSTAVIKLILIFSIIHLLSLNFHLIIIFFYRDHYINSWIIKFEINGDWFIIEHYAFII